jgi:DNA-binding PadR family transcriptional regulator
MGVLFAPKKLAVFIQLALILCSPPIVGINASIGLDRTRYTITLEGAARLRRWASSIKNRFEASYRAGSARTSYRKKRANALAKSTGRASSTRLKKSCLRKTKKR